MTFQSGQTSLIKNAQIVLYLKMTTNIVPLLLI